MRKSGWAVAAAGISSLVLLLTACGGSSSSSSTTGAASNPATQGTAGSSASTGSSSSTSSPASTATAQGTHSSSAANQSAQAQPSSAVSFPPVGTTVLIVLHSSLGWVMAKADDVVVYTFAKDTKGGAPQCTGSCASVWAPVTGMPKAGPADTFPGTFGLVTGAGGQKQITYDGYPLYVYVGAPALSTKGDGIDGVWHVVKLSEGDISSGT
jgi:predicted lipoprotein with Yx(FWY)xxD motif